jgi:cytoskeletal protein CcmA (bactofilin family)
MWNKAKPDVAPEPMPRSTAPPQPQPQPTAVARQPEPVAASSAPRGTAIGKGVTIIGDVVSKEDLFIDGDIKGNVEVQDSRCTVGPNGNARSNVKAREVVIQGKVQGDVEATQKITIRKDGSLVGNIKTMGIIIEDDAYFKGSIDIVRNGAPPKSNEKVA